MGAEIKKLNRKNKEKLHSNIRKHRNEIPKVPFHTY